MRAKHVVIPFVIGSGLALFVQGAALAEKLSHELAKQPIADAGSSSSSESPRASPTESIPESVSRVVTGFVRDLTSGIAELSSSATVQNVAPVRDAVGLPPQKSTGESVQRVSGDSAPKESLTTEKKPTQVLKSTADLTTDLAQKVPAEPVGKKTLTAENKPNRELKSAGEMAQAVSANPVAKESPIAEKKISRDLKSGNDLAQKAPVEPLGKAVLATDKKPAYDLSRKAVREAIKKDSNDLARDFTFDALILRSITNHPSINAKRSAYVAAQAELEGVGWQRFPTPSIEAATVSNQKSVGTLTVQQPIWSGGRISAGIDGAGANKKAAEVAIDEARREIVLKVIAAFAEAQRQQLRQQYASKSVREHEKLLSLIQRRVEQQINPQVDQDFAKARLMQAKNELSATNQALSSALNQLIQLSGQQVNKIIPMKTDISDLPVTKMEALDHSIASSPILSRIGFEEEAAGADISSKRSTYMPQVSVRYEKGLTSSDTNRVMLVLEAQPGAGLSAGSGVDAAVAKRETIRKNKEVALLEIQERITADWNELVASRQRVENSTQGRVMANEVSDSYSRQFTTGKKTWIDVLNSVREAVQSEQAVADAEAQLIAAALRLKLATGALVLPAVF